MEALNNIFGGQTRVRVMRLFLLNPDRAYEKKDVIAATHEKATEVERAVSSLEKAGLIKRRRYLREGKKSKTKVNGWTLNASFLYLTQLRNLLVNGILLKSHDVVRRLSRAGTLKLVVLAGIFIQDWENRVDLLIVGDKLKRGLLERIIHSMEGEIGRELRYSILDSADFQYRMNVGDHLVRDVFDYQHQTILDRLGVNA